MGSSVLPQLKKYLQISTITRLNKEKRLNISAIMANQ